MATAFAATPKSFSIPSSRCKTTFDALASYDAVHYALLDVDADRHADLVVTSDTCDEDVGKTHWDVYSASDAGFAPTPAPFSLPAARCNTSFDALAGSGSIAYALLDVNADRRADLVVTSDTCDAEVGKTHWDVYLAGDHGFAATPRPFALPAARCRTKFDALAATAPVRYALLDVDGDRRADLVVTSDTCDAEIGKSRWDLYPASDDGFATTPVAFSLPAARCQTKFDALAASASVHYALLDVNADRRPDLVVTSDTCDAEIGRRRWDVYAASEKGFAPAPAPFSLPASRCQTNFDALAASASLGYGLLDVSCDGRADLVVTTDSCDADVGATHWDVYAASDQGFAATPTALAVPTARCKVKFDAFAGNTGTTYAGLDVDADGRPDLVVTRDTCDADVGKDRWDVYPLQ